MSAPPSVEIQALHRESIVVDTHCDLIGRIVDGQRQLVEDSPAGQFDLRRAREGGLTAELLAMCFHPRRPRSPVRQMIQYFDAYYQLLDIHSDLALAATGAEDVLRAKAQGKVALFVSMEGAELLEGDLGALRVFHRWGLRCVGLTWNRRNEAADGVGELRTGGGLSEFGVALVKECNRLGILLDMAHLAPPGVQQVLELSEAPVVVTHANCHALWPNRRNLTDPQLEAVAAGGGVVGVTAVPAFLGEDEQRAPMSAMLDHLEHMVKVMGEDHVGLGMDYEGVGPARVVGVEDVSGLPNLTGGLAARGYRPETIRKILGENFLRVFRKVM